MTDRGADSRIFEEMIRTLLERGLSARFQARGASMSPAIRDGEVVQVTPVIVSKLRKGDIVLAKSNYGFRLHRIVSADAQRDLFITRGDCGQKNDPALTGSQILGLAEAKEVRVGRKVVQAKFRTLGGVALRTVARAQVAGSKISSDSLFSRGKRALLRVGILSLLLLISIFAGGQVVVDSSNSKGSEFTGAGTFTLNFNQTTTATANRLLIVGVSMNIANAPATAVSGVTYNGTALTLIGAHNDAGDTRRVEQWYLLNPASGTNPIIVSVQIPTGGAVVGVVAGSTTFTGVDQTVPLGSFVSSDGAAAVCDTSVTYGCASEYVPSVVNGMILDTLATGGTQTVTVSGPQVSQWNVRTNNGTTSADPPDVTATGSSRTGAPSVPISELFSGTSNWSLGAVPINPSTADIAVTTAVSAVPLGQNSTYNIAITNNGPSAANSVTLTDTYANTGLSIVSVTPSAGTTCTTGATITCNLPTPFASGAVATVVVVVSTTTAGFYPNTATIADSGTPVDPNTGNNTYVALAPVVSVVCSGATLSAGGTISGTVNTYYPGNGTVAAGATSIPVGTKVGTGAIAAGSLLLVIQMQDASINTSNTVAYGNGSTGAGFTTINNAGNYEFVKATGAVAGGNVGISGAGSGGGLVFGYTNAAPSNTKGISTFQVVLVPQYTTATLGALTAAAWNGRTGGIIAVDIAGQLNLGGATVHADGVGFRGGAGMQLTGSGTANNTDYRFAAPGTYTPPRTGADAPKGEGVAGTPLWAESGTTVLNTGSDYPSGGGADGSMAKGAPGNAGGGGTDADPANNDQNAGGGGGGNGGSGGFGGDSWNTNLSTGGEGGGTFPATIDRIALGGGGGAGTRNNSDGDTQASSGAAGGGMIFIRADSFTGTATLTANGANAYNGTDKDAGGGGGAGGTIVVLAANGGESGLTLQANGGSGGNAWQSLTYALSQRHGPGGGGGGGVIFVSGSPASMSVAGGSNGLTLKPGVPYGATAGDDGTTVTAATLGQVTGIQSAALCTPDMTLAKSHVGNFTRGTSATYTIPVSNISPYGATSGVVTINDTLPLGITPTSASGTGWTCSVSNQTVSCTRSDILAAANAYPSITLNATVSPSSPSTLVNTASVSGGGEANFLNDTASDTASVGSSADLSMADAASPNPVNSGSNITYTQTVTNNGPSSADNATMVTAIPANTTFVSMTAPAGWSCIAPAVGATGNVICTEVNMAALTSASFSLIVKVNGGVSNGTVIANTATASSSTADPTSTNNTASAATVVGTTSPNLTVTDAASPSPVQAGSNITYTQVVTNTGSSPALSGTFTESAPANTTFVSITPPAGWTCVAFPPTCTNPSVAGGSTATFTVVYKVNAGTAPGTVINDIVTVNAANQAFGANTAFATDVVAGGTQADLSLATAGSPNRVWAGNDITYTQTITNNGPTTSSGVVFTEATPTNTTFQSVIAPAGWACTTPAVGATGTVTCNDPSLASGASADIIVVVNVPASVAPTTITASSSVSATTSDPFLSNNSTTVSTVVGAACDLAVTNSGTPSPITAGANITYTQTITNNGPSNCTGGTFNEATPVNTTFVSVAVVPTGGAGTWTCPNSAPVACTNPSVAPGSVATITAVYTVNAGTASGTIISDTDTVGASQDVVSANNSATVNIAVAVAGQADLSVTNSASPNPVNAGSTITYTQSVTNSGPANAAAPVLTETLPANTTFVSLSGPAGWTCTITAPYKCTDGSAMTANTTANFSFVVKVNTNVASGTNIAETDTVSSTTTDPSSANNSITVNTQVADSADLAITNSASPQGVQAGNNITYTQVVTNNGPSTATTATMTETTPANTTFQSITIPGGWSCTTPAVGATGTINCTNATFAPGSSTFTVVLKVTAGTAAGTQISDTATVSSAITDPNQANNSATATDVVALITQSNLVVTNSPSPTTVAAGSNITYTQSVQNTGPAITSTGVTFTEPTPPNTTFVSMTNPGGGWSCSTPTAGTTGTITCTNTGTLAVNATANFTLVLQVNSSTPSGTNITDTATATVSNMVPGITTNTASATVLVGNANSADMAIVKTASPNPVTEGTLFTYTLTVTNNGPASATTVTVTDSLPAVMTYLSSTTSQGSCSEAGGTVTCLLGTMANAATATITIVALPNAAGIYSNTASVTADQTDSNQANNSSTWNETVVTPTAIKLQWFTAQIGAAPNGAARVALNWKTGGEVHNLGFNVYRELSGNRVRMNSSLIAGSALLMSGALPKHSGKTYSWTDSSTPVPGTSYWLEDVDVNGTRTMHGPVSATYAATVSTAAADQSRTLRQLSQAQVAPESAQGGQEIETYPRRAAITQAQIEQQFELAAHPAIKISVQHEGWYRVTQPELVKAGFDPSVDPALLHLYAEGIEQPIEVTGANAGPGGLGSGAAINFYGTGIDTPFSGTRVYWLTVGEAPGERIPHSQPATGSNQPSPSYPATVEIRQHTTYFAALLTQNEDNFFGALVSPTPVDQVLTTPRVNTKSTNPGYLEVVLQGVIVAYPHNVEVAVNGTPVGSIIFTGQDKGKLNVALPSGVLRDWINTVTLTSQNGDYDTSLVESIRLTYPHLYVAESDHLKFTARAGDEVSVSGFVTAPTVLDITDPDHPVGVTPKIDSNDGKIAIALQVPWTTTNPTNPVRHTLLAVGQSRVRKAFAVLPNHPSQWHSIQAGADIAMVTANDFAGTLGPLVRAHAAQGQTSAVIAVGDLYDEFNFGESSPFAIRQFLATAKKNWKKPPSYLLLNGRASFDPRNYLGFGNLDLVPTRILPLTTLMTASDDWFSDFKETGMPMIATGRLPVSTQEEAKTVIDKIAAYEGQSTNGPWTLQSLMIADKDDAESFSQDTLQVQAQLPATMQATDIFTGTVGTSAAQQGIINGINSGQLLVNYIGHGSEEQWSGSNIFDTNSVAALTNTSQLPVFLIMDCLNGFFQDVYSQPLGVDLLLAPNGGAVAVLASTALNQPAPQVTLDTLVVQDALGTSHPALGDAVVNAKKHVDDPSVRRTFVLLGDPAMKIKQPANASH